MLWVISWLDVSSLSRVYFGLTHRRLVLAGVIVVRRHMWRLQANVDRMLLLLAVEGEPNEYHNNNIIIIISNAETNTIGNPG